MEYDNEGAARARTEREREISEKMRKLERDRIFYRREYERERDSGRRRWILEQIRNTEAAALATMREYSEMIREDTRLMQEALERARRRRIVQDTMTGQSKK